MGEFLTRDSLARYERWNQPPALEVYVRPAIPPEFLQCGFPCGVVVLWTRRLTPAELEVPRWRKTLLGVGILGVGFALMFF